MAITINGTTGLAGVDGSASTPAVQGGDSNTGVFFPAADTVAIATGGSERLRADSSGNVGIGTSSPTFASGGGLQVKNAGFTSVRVTSSSSTGIDFAQDTSANGYMYNRDNAALIFGTNNTERARIDSSGRWLVGATTTSISSSQSGEVYSTGITGFALINSTAGNWAGSVLNQGTSGTRNLIRFMEGAGGGTQRGSITTDGSTVAYNTTSDYRLKESAQPMTGALAKITALKPCTYIWKESGLAGEGFIAHELAEVVPQCVTGEKDAVDAEGNPKYQGIDTSFLVATLTAAIQELKAELDTAKARIAALEAA